MKIAINCSYFQPFGCGVKEYIKNLVENLSLLDKENEYVLYALADTYEYARLGLNTRFRIKRIPFGGGSLIKVVKRSLFSGSFWRKEEEIEKWDIFHSPFYYSPKLKNTPVVLTVHDIRFVRYPGTYKFLRYQYLRRVVKQSVMRADRIIAVSQFTKNELCEAYGISGENIRVVHEAVNPEHFRCSETEEYIWQNFGMVRCLEGAPYILTVGTLEPRKNFDRLIEAFERAKSSLPQGTKLVIVGKKYKGYKSLMTTIRENNDICYLDFVPQPLLNRLYREASLFIFPSIYEGFGFPPLEAGLHGVPSVVSNMSSMPEVCGNAALYFNPFDVEDMADKISAVFKDESLRAGLSARMALRLNDFSWRQNARDTMAVYSSLRPSLNKNWGTGS